MALTLDIDQGPVITSLDNHLQDAYANGVTIAGGTPSAIAGIPGLDRLSDADLTTGREGMEIGFAAFLKAMRLPPTTYNITGFLNGFGQHAGADYGAGHCRYWKDAMGYVLLDGLADTPASPNGKALAQLPAGYRPVTGDIYPAAAQGATAKIQVLSDGYITAVEAPGLTWLSLAGIRFYAG